MKPEVKYLAGYNPFLTKVNIFVRLAPLKLALMLVTSRGQTIQIKKIRHRELEFAILYTLYSRGLRLGELLNLRCTDVYRDRNQVFIRAGKSKKDRVMMLSTILKDLLVHYFDACQPRHWLFEGQNGNEPYTNRSVQAIVKKAARKAALIRKVTPHTIRHFFATHLLDSGTDVRYIQELLGHKGIKTNLVHTHVTTSSLSAIESPLDQIEAGISFS
jgi:integrase/recombinase XerD